MMQPCSENHWCLLISIGFLQKLHWSHSMPKFISHYLSYFLFTTFSFSPSSYWSFPLPYSFPYILLIWSYSKFRCEKYLLLFVYYFNPFSWEICWHINIFLGLDLISMVRTYKRKIKRRLISEKKCRACCTSCC